MKDLQNILDASVANGDLPFAVAMVAGKGQILWAGASGEQSTGVKASPSTGFRIFSMTKAVASTAAMILIERGLLDPEATVESILPEFAALQVLNGFDGDKPLLRAPKTKATIRQLATHTSGLEYELWNTGIGQYFATTGNPTVLSGLKAGLHYPLASDPGTRWAYGISTDWLGQVIEKVSGQRIDAFCQKEIFNPLSMQDTMFEVSAALGQRMAGVSIRGEGGVFGPMDIAPPSNPEVYGMGHALYSTAPDYIKFLQLFLNRGEAGGDQILSEHSIDWMLADQTGGLRFNKLISGVPPLTADFDPFPGIAKSHSFGFLRVDGDVPGMRSAGSQSWAGLLNSHYWFDPKKGVAAMLMTQSLPFVDPRYMATYEKFERAVYAGLP
jgi:methyl acetate hydrolase